MNGAFKALDFRLNDLSMIRPFFLMVAFPKRVLLVDVQIQLNAAVKFSHKEMVARELPIVQTALKGKSVFRGSIKNVSELREENVNLFWQGAVKKESHTFRRKQLTLPVNAESPRLSRKGYRR